MVDAASILSALAARGIDASAFGVAPERLVAHIQSLGAPDASHFADITLGFACSEGHAGALAEFQRLYGGEYAGALSRLSLGRAEIDEVAQTVRERLFMSRAGARPKILDYAGRGPLAGWLRAVIVRAGIDHRRKLARDPTQAVDDEPLVDLGETSRDPELESLRKRYEEPFRVAFRDAVRMLPTDERNALRLNVAESLNIEQIGVLYGVHRATVARWIASARESIAQTTRRLLAERLGLPAKDIESLVRLCQSRLDVGFSVLGSNAPTEVGEVTASGPTSSARRH
jgi:RNA polymerase sigma-70 factor (ECF subfamily)